MLKLLLVDDNSGNLFLHTRILNQLGCEVIECTNPLEAFTSLLPAQHFDVIFTDLEMPGMTGLQFLDRVKADYPETPVVLTSILPHPDLQLLALSKGAAYCLFEQHTQADFKKVLEKVCPQKWKAAL